MGDTIIKVKKYSYQIPKTNPEDYRNQMAWYD